MTSKESMDLFQGMGVMSETEIKARHEVELEAYILHLQIEGRVFDELVYNQIVPAAIGYQNILIKNVLGLKEIYGAAHKKLSDGQSGIIEKIAEHIVELKKKTDAMTDTRRKANKIADTRKKASAYCENVKPYFDEIRSHCDQLEQLIDDHLGH